MVALSWWNFGLFEKIQQQLLYVLPLSPRCPDYMQKQCFGCRCALDFENLRCLSCMHTYCKECLSRVEKTRHGTILCPTCHEESHSFYALALQRMPVVENDEDDRMSLVEDLVTKDNGNGTYVVKYHRHLDYGERHVGTCKDDSEQDSYILGSESDSPLHEDLPALTEDSSSSCGNSSPPICGISWSSCGDGPPIPKFQFFHGNGYIRHHDDKYYTEVDKKAIEVLHSEIANDPRDDSAIEARHIPQTSDAYTSNQMAQPRDHVLPYCKPGYAIANKPLPAINRHDISIADAGGAAAETQFQSTSSSKSENKSVTLPSSERHPKYFCPGYLYMSEPNPKAGMNGIFIPKYQQALLCI
jgi:hypothetical protein